MTMKYAVIVPQGWRMDLVGIKDPVEVYETMARVAQAAEELGYDSFWLFDISLHLTRQCDVVAGRSRGQYI